MTKYIFILLSCFYLYTPSIAQERKLVYDVIRNGKVIGDINFVEMTQGQKKFLSMNSHVETTVIIPVKDHTAETAAFDKGIMVYASFYQKQTGSDEVNKTTTVSGKSYKVTDKGESRLIKMAPVHFNTLLLYTNIPAGINKIYSANYQKMVDIEKLAEDKYRLLLPDGKFNDYTYKNGVCVKVEIVRSLGTVEFVLREK